MKQKIHLFVVVLFLFLVLLVIFLLLRYEDIASPKKKMSNQTGSQIALSKTYTNTVFHFSFSYPADFVLSEAASSYILLRPKSAGQYDWLYSVNIDSDAEKTNGSFESFAIQRAMLGCAADGPGAHIECNKVLTQTKFVTPNNIEGIKLYLNQQTTSSKNGKQEVANGNRGPLYILNIQSLTENKARTLSIGGVNGTPLSKEQEDILEKMVNTIVFSN